MSNLGDLITRVGLDDSQWKAGVNTIENDVRKLGKLGSSLTSFGASLTASLTLPLAGIGAVSVKSAADMDALKRGLAAVTGSASAAGAQFERLRDVAKLPGLGFKEAVQGAINLQAVGFSATEAQRALMVFGNALASVGRGKADLDGVIVQLQQMSGKSKVLAEDVKPLIQRVPQLAAVMKQLWGTVDTEQLQKMGIGAQEFVQKVTDELEKLPKVTGGVKNALENMADSMQIALASLGAGMAPFVESFIANVAEPILKKIEEVGKAFASLGPAVQGVVLSFAGMTAALGPSLVIIGQMAQGVVALSGALKAAGIATSAFGIAINAIGWGAIAFGVATLAAGMWDLHTAVNAMAQSEQDLRKSVAKLEAHLKSVGVDVSKHAQAYKDGQISAEKYSQVLSGLAKAHGDANKAQLQHKATLSTVPDALRRITEEQKKANEELVKAKAVLAEAERQYRSGSISALDLARAQNAVRDASKNAGIDLDRLASVAKKAKEEADALKEAWKELEDRLASETLKEASQAIDEAIAKQIESIKRFNEHVAAMWDLMVSDAHTARVQRNLSLVDTSITELAAAMKRLGGDSEAALRQAMRDYEVLRENMDGVIVTAHDVEEALNNVRKAQGEQVKEGIEGAKKQSGALREVSTILTNLHQDIAKLIINWKGFGDTAVAIVKRIGEAIIADLIKNLILTEERMKAVNEAIKVGLSKVPGLGKVFDAAADTSTKVTTQEIGKATAQTAGQAAGAVGNSAGQAGSGAASSGATGWVNAISSAVSAITDVLSYLQGRRMEQDIGRIEVTTRGQLNQLISLQHTFNQWLPRIVDTIAAAFGDGVLQQIRDVLWYGKVNVHVASSTDPNSADALLSPLDSEWADMQRKLIDAGRADVDALINLGSAADQSADGLGNLGGALAEIPDYMDGASKSLMKLSMAASDAAGSTADVGAGMSDRAKAELSWLMGQPNRDAAFNSFWAERSKKWTGMIDGFKVPTGSEIMADWNDALRAGVPFGVNDPLAAYRGDPTLLATAFASIRAYQEAHPLQEGQYLLPPINRGEPGGAIVNDALFAAEAWERANAKWDFNEGKLSMEEYADAQAKITDKYQEILRQKFLKEGFTGLTKDQEALQAAMQASAQRLRDNAFTVRDLNHQIAQLRQQAFQTGQSTNPQVLDLIRNSGLWGQVDPQAGVSGKSLGGPTEGLSVSQQNAIWQQIMKTPPQPADGNAALNSKISLDNIKLPPGADLAYVQKMYYAYMNDIQMQMRQGQITWGEYGRLAGGASNWLGRLSMAFANRPSAANPFPGRIFRDGDMPQGRFTLPIAPGPINDSPLWDSQDPIAAVTVYATEPGARATATALSGALRDQGIRLK